MHDSNDIKSLIREIEQGFDALRDRAKDDQSQLYGHKEYSNSLIAGLHESITTRVPVPSALPGVAARQLEGILRVSLSFHVEPPPDHRDQDRSPSKQRADKAELFYAHLWNQLDNGGRTASTTRRLQAVSPFAPWWLSYKPFQLPKDPEAREQYRRTYWPFELEVCDPSTVSFLPDADGQPTIAARHFELPYVEVVKRYHDDKPEDDIYALSILNSRFGYLRGGRGAEVSRGDFYRKKAEVWIIDDLNCCYHCVKGLDGEYHQETEDYPNPWGGSPLILVPGGYNPDAVELADRYEPLLRPLFRSQRVLDVLDSHMASIILTPSKPVEQLPESVAAQLAADEQAARAISVNDAGITSILGDLGEINLVLDPNVKDLRAMRVADRDEAKPPPFLTNPDQGLVKYGTAAAQLNAQETSNRTYDAARESFIAGIHMVCDRVKHFIKYGYADFNTKGAPEERIHWTMTGKEPSKQFAGEYTGKQLDIGPEDFVDEDTLEISIVASSQAQKQLEFELAHQQRALGYKTFDQVLETFTEDVTGQKMMIEAEMRYQQNAPLIDNAQLLSDIEAIVAEGGPDFSMLFLPQMGGGGDPQQQGSPPAPPNGLQTQTTIPPPTAPSDVSVQ